MKAAFIGIPRVDRASVAFFSVAFKFAVDHHNDASEIAPLTCNHLVAYYLHMDEVFKALADASRRSLLDRLQAKNGQTLNELCDGLDMTRQAVTKHLAILEAANLVTTFKHGREKLHYLNPVPIHQIGERWIKKFERAKLTALSELKRQLEKRDE
jgi:DNA-binding transcriptional ArsR family regulator